MQTTDASEHPLATIISQKDHPVIYLSRKFTAAETNYSNSKKGRTSNNVGHEKGVKLLIRAEICSKGGPQIVRIYM